MRYPFFKKQIPRREWFLTFIKIKNQRDRGSYWINLVLSICNPQTLIATTLLISLKLTQVGYDFSFWLLLILLAISGVLMEIVKWRIGRQDYKKWKLWELEAEWVTKNKVVAPFNRELMADMKQICEKLGLKSNFKDLDRK